MRKSNIRLISLIALLFLSLILIAVFIKPEKPQKPLETDYSISEETDKLVIVNLDVGKADSAFVEYNGLCGIIDTGTKESYDIIKEYLDDNDRTSMNFMLITHYDKDHVGSAVKLIQNYDISKIYLPDYVSSKSGYAKLMEEIQGKDNVVFVSSPQEVMLGDVTMNILPADDQEALITDADNMDNNMSLLCMLTYGEKKFLFTGDVEKDRINQILASGADLKADWIKLPHHGDYKSNTPEFLEMVSPQYSVVSTGPERPTEDKLLALLSDMKIQNYCTMWGTVITTCNGKEITVKNLN
jgi:beta-lactamase superfamily II metal-dependent hydrolase